MRLDYRCQGQAPTRCSATDTLLCRAVGRTDNDSLPSPVAIGRVELVAGQTHGVLVRRLCFDRSSSDADAQFQLRSRICCQGHPFDRAPDSLCGHGGIFRARSCMNKSELPAAKVAPSSVVRIGTIAGKF